MKKYTTPRILMLQLEYEPIFSGHGLYLKQLIKKLRNLNCEASILAGDFHKFPEFEKIEGIDVYRFPFSHNEKYWEIKLSLNVIKFLFVNKNKYDILHINGHLDVYGLITLFNIFIRKRTIYQMVLYGADDPMTLLGIYKFMRLRYKILALMDRFLCISKKIAESYIKANLPVNKLNYIPQGVDLDKFFPAENSLKKELLKKDLKLNKYDNIVIFVGAIVKRKGVDLLIDAWKILQSQFPDTWLLLIGQDVFDNNDVNKTKLNTFVASLKNTVEKNNLNVIFKGTLNNVNEFLRCADIFVLPSRKEGFGNVIIEAMASGLPAVITYMDGVSEETVKHGENGYIVRNADKLADFIKNLLEDKYLSKKMGSIGRNMAVENFSLNEIAKEYKKIYCEILGK